MVSVVASFAVGFTVGLWKSRENVRLGENRPEKQMGKARSHCREQLELS